MILTNVVPSFWGANFHSTVVRPLYPSHSMRIRLFGSIAFTVTSVEASYIFPFPFDLLTDFGPATALRKPELGRDVRVNERRKHIGDRPADEHPGLCNRHLLKLEIVHVDSFERLTYSVLSLKHGGNEVSAKSPKWRQGDKTCWTKPRSSASVAAMEIVKWGRSAECGAWLAIDREV